MGNKHRKCDTTKYRKRMARQRANVESRKERERVQAAIERDRALAARMEAERRHREDPRTQLGQRLVNTLRTHLESRPLFKIVTIASFFGVDVEDLMEQAARQLESSVPQLVPYPVASPMVASPLQVPALTPRVDIRPICRLCKQPITLDESKAKNCKPIQYNRRWVVVHITCPMKA